MTWLTRTPLAIIKVCVAMMPRLQAEESLSAVERTAIGSGSLKTSDAHAITRRWARTASGREQIERLSPAGLQAIGIGYQIVPKEPTP
jgi:hypothetical protein